MLTKFIASLFFKRLVRAGIVYLVRCTETKHDDNLLELFDSYYKEG